MSSLVHSEAEGLSVPTEQADKPAAPVTGWDEFGDDISDAISDSFDMDWNAGDGARAVVRWLDENEPQGVVAAQNKADRDGLLAALRVAYHALVTSDNYRVTDLSVETFEAKLASGVARDKLEFMTDFSAELATIEAAIAKATGAAS